MLYEKAIVSFPLHKNDTDLDLQSQMFYELCVIESTVMIYDYDGELNGRSRICVTFMPCSYEDLSLEGWFIQTTSRNGSILMKLGLTQLTHACYSVTNATTCYRAHRTKRVLCWGLGHGGI